MTNNYDIIIIGSGIAGLYSAYTIQKTAPKMRILILEKHKKQYIGGREGNDTFYGTEIVTGAGIGRKKKDVLLIQLMKSLDIPIRESKMIPYYASTIKDLVDVNKTMDYLRSEYNKQGRPNITFKEFAKPILGRKLYTDFLTCVGYTDYEKSDVYETLYNYGMEDNVSHSTIINVPWRQLVLDLYNKIGSHNFKFSNNVTKIEKRENSLFTVTTETGKSYSSQKVIIATTITGIQQLLPDISLYKEIHGQTFLRLYAKFSKQSIPILNNYSKGYTIVPGPLQKIIPMDSSKGVYMIAYSDNENAIMLKNYLKNTEKNCTFFARLVEEAIGIPAGQLHIIAIKDYYWPVGTHYYEPLSSYKKREDFMYQIQHPESGLLVVGEAVSRHQGWSEGALESVKVVVTRKWLNET